jgi:hypothetical protein
MAQILFEYQMNAVTWVYVSSLLIIGIYFKFHRFWSVRNLDLVALMAFAFGFVLITHKQPATGYLWLFGVSGFFLVRLLLDPVMVRRPLLEPNLSSSGLTFTCFALVLFLLANVITRPAFEGGRRSVEQIEGDPWTMMRWEDTLYGPAADHPGRYAQQGPGYAPFLAMADLANRRLAAAAAGPAHAPRQRVLWSAATRTTAVLGHLAILIGLILIGYRHFGSARTGVAAASLYLLLPYTAEFTCRIDHVIPGALLVWAVVAYRRPLIAGAWVGLAAGIIYYPLFLLPLWCGFYWRRGLARFLIGVALVLAILVASLAWTSGDPHTFADLAARMFGGKSLSADHATGYWALHDVAYRVPVIAVFFVVAVSMALWPAQKNLGTLLSCSAAVLVGTQFWHAHYAGIYLGWYLPLLILTIFRPNLEDRMALTAVREVRLFRSGWTWRNMLKRSPR